MSLTDVDDVASSAIQMEIFMGGTIYSTKHILEVKNPRLIETHFRSPQLDLWQRSETEWLLALRQPERKRGKRRRTPREILQLRLPNIDTAG